MYVHVCMRCGHACTLIVYVCTACVGPQWCREASVCARVLCAHVQDMHTYTNTYVCKCSSMSAHQNMKEERDT